MPKIRKHKFNRKKLLKVFLYSLLFFTLFASATFAWFAKDLPTPAKIAKMRPSQSTKIFDRNGTLLYETGELKRTLVTSDQMSPLVKQATVAVEDQQFYSNYGINFRGVARAAFRDIFHIGSGVQGGSTITQQYVKNALLYSKQTIARKIKEVILAIELEFMYSKDQILTMYLNEIPYGGQTAGVEAASQLYYGKSAKDISLAQAATLAAIPQAPTFYSPYGTHTDRLIYRRNYVLDQMVKMKYITKEQAEEAKKEDTTTVGVSVKPRRQAMLAPHFSMYILEQASAEFGEQRVEKEGLSITTSLDYNLQKTAETAVNNGMAKVGKYGGSNGALTAIDPKNGQVLAMVGSKDFFDTTIDGNVNVSTSLRQPGSSFKPYVYATALKRDDFSPSRILFDLTTDFGGGYVPHNYDNNTHGPVTVRQALSNSLNIPAVKTTDLVGIDNILTTASDMGITPLTDRDRYGDSLGLGVGEISLLEHTNGFAVFANNGNHHDIHPILKVTDKAGKTIYEYKQEDDKGTQALDPQLAFEMQNIMSDNAARGMVFGTRSPLAFSDRPVGAKTGTTSDFRDAWTVGYTPSISVGIWVGNNNNKAMSRGADGVVVAAPIFHEFMVNFNKDKPVEQFVAPEGMSTITVERYSNKLPTAYSKVTTTDIFAKWQVPKDKDDVNIAINVCKANGLPAPDGTPAALVETKVFSNIHSERPKNPNWENPVIGWAQAAGLYAPAPSGSCDVNNIAPPITVSITSPTNDATVSGTGSLSATASNSANVSKIEFFIDGVSVGSDSSSPYSVSYNFDGLSTGRHSLTAIATDVNGVASQDQISFASIHGGMSITGTSASGVTSNSATITWTTAISSTSQVFYDTVSHTNYNEYLYPSSKNSSLVTSHTINLTGLNPSTTYHFRAVSTADLNIESSSDFTFTTGS
ncbi:MAG: 1A family penicillin-binding protein [Candidatus Berkelbacteria bacterium Athens1014_28]|uniref:1A family penicillin-binding protein n=1 Tax=Candidatus Berkelbacteria bacterium Athens1014_28 TaxID=2017145 RepID=A0A554LQ24_9BACT|nr:MAG: 1A family penicillin-binding protein [Candidatus Berkelbacteria bacterium Athens1014_28]